MAALKCFNSSSCNGALSLVAISAMRLLQITIFIFLMLSTYKLGGEEQEQLMDQSQVFLPTIYGPTPPGFFAVWTKDNSQTLWIPGDQIDRIPDIAKKLAESKEVYFGVGLQEFPLGSKSRGTRKTVSAIGAFWMDIDIFDASHKNEKLPFSYEEALAFLDELPLKPSIIVNSGHGLHVYWLLPELWIFENDQDRQHAQTLAHDFQKVIIQLAQKHGWILDSTHDLARVLRVPGTVNRKNSPVPVEIIKFEPTHRYSFEEFIKFVENQLSTPSSSASDSHIDERSTKHFAPADFESIAKECLWLQHCREDAQTLPEPEWYGMFSIVGHCQNGKTLAHELSAPYPNYSPEETEDKLQQALNNSGPRTCQNINDMTNGRFCQNCAHWGHIKSPIVLGTNNSKRNWEEGLQRNPIDALNERHATLMTEGKFCILNEEIDSLTGWKKLSLSSRRDFEYRYAPHEIEFAFDNTVKMVPATQLWFKSRNRRSYQGLTFKPNGEGLGKYNIWQGFGVTPRKGNCERYLTHIYENIADGKKEIYEYILNWMAHTVQFPEERIGVAIVLRGRQGTGKGVMCTEFGKLFGPHFVHIHRDQHLLGKFNSHLMGALVIYADEAFWAGDKASEGVLKAMITEETVFIEMKGKDAIPFDNYARLLIASNQSWVVPADLDDRRFFLVDVGESHAQDHGYFSALIQEMENGGRDALLHHLLNFDLSDVNLRKFPKTQAHWENKLFTMPTAGKFFFERLMEGKLTHRADRWERVIERSILHDEYIMFAEKIGQNRRSTETEIGIQLNKYFRNPKVKRDKKNIDGQQRLVYIFPSLGECRKAFEDITGIQHEWPSEQLPTENQNLPFS